MKSKAIRSSPFCRLLVLLIAAALRHPGLCAEPAESMPAEQSGPATPARPVCVECDLIRLPLTDAARLVMNSPGAQETSLHAQAAALISAGRAKRVSYQSATAREGGRAKVFGVMDEPYHVEWRISGEDERVAWRALGEPHMCGYEMEFEPSLVGSSGNISLNIGIKSDRLLVPQRWETKSGTVESMRNLSCTLSSPGSMPPGEWCLRGVLSEEPLTSQPPGLTAPDGPDDAPFCTMVFLRATAGPGPAAPVRQGVAACTISGELLITDLPTATAAAAGLSTLSDGAVIRDRLSAAAAAVPERVRIGGLFALPVDHGQRARQRTEGNVSWRTQYADPEAIRDEARRQHLMEGKTPLPVPNPPVAAPETPPLVMVTQDTGVSLEVAATRLPDAGEWLIRHDLWLGHVPGVEKVDPSDADPLAPVEAVSRELSTAGTSRQKPGTLWLAGMRQMQDQDKASTQVVMLFLRLTEEILP